MKKIYQVLSQCDAYITTAWFENNCFADACNKAFPSKETNITEFLVDDDFVKRNNIYLEDAEFYSEEEWEIIEAHGLDV